MEPDPHGSRAERVAYYDALEALDMAGEPGAPCSVCGFEIDGDDWENRHDDMVTGTDCHAACCPSCRTDDLDQRADIDERGGK